MVFGVRVALPVGCTLSDEVSLESVGVRLETKRIARPWASVIHTGSIYRAPDVVM